MKSLDGELATETSRRRFLAQAVLGTAGFAAAPALAQQLVDLHLPGGNSDRPVTDAFPGKGRMILQRIHPPLLETPMEVFDKSVFTPNDQFYVRWHWADIPTSINVDSFRLEVSGHVDKPISISLDRLLSLPRIEYAAVNQCSGNSRGLFVPRVPGAQWGNGAMGNAKWLGVSLRSVLDLAGVRPGAAQVRFGGLDQPVVPDGPDYFKSLAIDHARDGEVMIAFGMNGEQLPLLNGFPCRLIVPGWYSTYWVKMLSSIEVLPGPDDKYWMAKAYKIPDTSRADVKPGATGYKTVPINKMVPRSWVTSLGDGQAIAYEPTIPLGGIAMGGDCGVARVAVSADGGRSWYQTQLGPDEGKYSFRRWDARVPLPGPGSVKLMSRCSNTDGVSQPMQPIWNSGGYMRGNIEITTIVAS